MHGNPCNVNDNYHDNSNSINEELVCFYKYSALVLRNYLNTWVVNNHLNTTFHKYV